MSKPRHEAPIADEPPTANVLTPYDEAHLVLYLRLLDAEADGAGWREVAGVVLKIDPEKEPGRARRAYDTHLARAQWMTRSGYKHLLRKSGPEASS